MILSALSPSAVGFWGHDTVLYSHRISMLLTQSWPLDRSRSSRSAMGKNRFSRRRARGGNSDAWQLKSRFSFCSWNQKPTAVVIATRHQLLGWPDTRFTGNFTLFTCLAYPVSSPNSATVFPFCSPYDAFAPPPN